MLPREPRLAPGELGALARLDDVAPEAMGGSKAKAREQAAEIAKLNAMRGHVAYGRPGLIGITGLVLVAAASVAVSYWRVRGYA